MRTDLDQQIEYWNRVGSTKSFLHPVNLDRLSDLLAPTASIVDYGCGYGRVLKILFEHGYRNIAGFDLAPAMVEEARQRLPGVELGRRADFTSSAPGCGWSE